MEENLVSILIPTYNRVNIIRETIESAICQTYKNIEIIIVDNCSTDGTSEILENYGAIDSRIRIFKNEKNLGPVLNWEICLNMAQGVYSKFLWSDDLIKTTFIEDALNYFDNETAFVLSGIEFFDDNGTLCKTTFQNRALYTTTRYLDELLIYKDIDFPVSPGCALFRTADLKKSLVINISNNLNLDFSQFGAGNDLLFFLITAMNYKYVKTTSTIQSYFRAHSNSFSVANKLDLFYFYSTYYYVKIYRKDLYSKFYTAIKLRSLLTSNHYYLDNIEKGSFDMKVIFNFIYKKIFKKFINSLFQLSGLVHSK